MPQHAPHALYPLDRRARSALALQEVARVGLTAQALRQPQHDVSVRSPVDVSVRLIRRSGQLASRTVIGYQVGTRSAQGQLGTRESAAVWCYGPSDRPGLADCHTLVTAS